MDLIDAEIAVGLINDYWPHSLDPQQVASWARPIAQTGADFDATCKVIAQLATQQAHRPSLADICTSIRPAPKPPEPEDTGPPVPQSRGQAWAAHVASVGRIAAARQEQHDHRLEWLSCPVCTQPGDYSRCSIPNCRICS